MTKAKLNDILADPKIQSHTERVLALQQEERQTRVKLGGIIAAIGAELLAVKDALDKTSGKTTWLRWLKDHVHYSTDTAECYMDAARFGQKFRNAAEFFSLDPSILYRIAALPDEIAVNLTPDTLLTDPQTGRQATRKDIWGPTPDVLAPSTARRAGEYGVIPALLPDRALSVSVSAAVRMAAAYSYTYFYTQLYLLPWPLQRQFRRSHSAARRAGMRALQSHNSPDRTTFPRRLHPTLEGRHYAVRSIPVDSLSNCMYDIQIKHNLGHKNIATTLEYRRHLLPSDIINTQPSDVSASPVSNFQFPAPCFL